MAAWAFISLLMAGCVVEPVVPLTERENKFGQTDEEQKLIRRSEQLESELRNRGLVLDDEVVNRYVQRVGQSLIPAQAATSLQIRFYVLRDPFINAFALPNGGIYLNVGLMARLTNEAQLAHVLGHEISHVVQRHGLQSLRNRKATMVSAHILDLALFGTSLAYLPAMGALAGHSQAAESESDRLALDLMAQAGYSLRGAEELFKLMQEVNERESFMGSVYSSHPGNVERANLTRGWLNERQVDVNRGAVNEADYHKIRDRIVLENLRLKLNLHQYALTLQAVDRDLALRPMSPWLYYYRGEAYRQMAEDPEGAAREEAWIEGQSYSKDRKDHYIKVKGEHLAKAQQSFRQALEIDRTFFHSHRGLGLVAVASGQGEAARQELNFYLQLGHDISDRGYINSILGRIKQ